MNFSLIRCLVVGAAIAALFISLVGQTAMADGRNGSRHDKEVNHHKSVKHDKRAKHQKKVKHLKNLKCTSGQVAKSNGVRSWSCAPDADTNTDTLADLECMNGDIVVFDVGTRTRPALPTTAIGAFRLSRSCGPSRIVALAYRVSTRFSSVRRRRPATGHLLLSAAPSLRGS